MPPETIAGIAGREREQEEELDQLVAALLRELSRRRPKKLMP